MNSRRNAEPAEKEHQIESKVKQAQLERTLQDQQKALVELKDAASCLTQAKIISSTRKGDVGMLNFERRKMRKQLKRLHQPAWEKQLQRLHQPAWEKQLSRSAAPELVGWFQDKLANQSLSQELRIEAAKSLSAFGNQALSALSRRGRRCSWLL